MATMIYCDRCARSGDRVAALFRVTFERLEAPYGSADHPMDLCVQHYEQLWAGL